MFSLVSRKLLAMRNITLYSVYAQRNFNVANIDNKYRTDPTKISENKEVQKLRLLKNVNYELHVLNQYLYYQIELSDS